MRALTILGSEITLVSSATTSVNLARIVRLVVTGTTPRLVTIKDASGTDKGTISIIPYEQIFIAKGHTDTLAVDNAGSTAADTKAGAVSFF